MKVQDCWTQSAVENWSDAKVKAWAGRMANPNEFLYRFPSPGEPQATGRFTTEEQRLFDQRVAEFTSKGWPLSCWGLFSLGIPGRVGHQCAAQYRKQADGEQGGARATAAQSAACQTHHAVQIEQIWADARVQRVTAKVEQWLKNRQQAVAATQQQEQAAQGSAVPGGAQQAPKGRAGPAVPAGRVQLGNHASATGVAAPRQRQYEWSDPDSDFEAAPCTESRLAKAVQSRAVATGRASGSSLAAGFGKPAVAGPAAAHPGSGPARAAAEAAVLGKPKGTDALTGTGLAARPAPAMRLSPAATAAAPGSPSGQGQRQFEPSPRGSRLPSKLSLGASRGAGACAQQQSCAAAAPVQDALKGAGVHRFGPGGLGTGGGNAAAAPTLKSQTHAALRPGLGPSSSGNRKAPATQKREPAGRATTAAAAALRADSDSDSEFVAGTLRQAPVQLPPPATSGRAASASKPAKPKPSGKRKRVWKSDSLILASDTLPGAAAQSHEAQVVPIKLAHDGSTHIPGWAPRTVAPYRPPQPPAAALEAAAASGPVYWEVPSVADAGEEVASGVPFQAALISPGWWEQEEEGDPVQRLAKLPLPKLVPTGFVFIWAQKQHIHQVCRLLNRGGYVYVENLTWAFLSPGDAILHLTAPLARSSHLTLLIFRREGEGKDIELRHQRTPDVIFGCVARGPSGGTTVPREVFEAIETLLPTGKGKFVELWAPKGVRRSGWTHIVETGDGARVEQQRGGGRCRGASER